MDEIPVGLQAAQFDSSTHFLSILTLLIRVVILVILAVMLLLEKHKLILNRLNELLRLLFHMV